MIAHNAQMESQALSKTATKNVTQVKSVDIKNHAETNKMLWTREVLTYLAYGKSENRLKLMEPDNVKDMSAPGTWYIGQYVINFDGDNEDDIFRMGMMQAGGATGYAQNPTTISVRQYGAFPESGKIAERISNVEIEDFLANYSGELVEIKKNN